MATPGFSFGQATQSTPQASTAPFGTQSIFGQTSQASAQPFSFGQQTTATSSTPFGFGTPTATNTLGTSLGTFGQTSQPFSFSTPATTSSSAFNFGSTSAFGQTGGQAAGGLFGSRTTQPFTLGSFGTTGLTQQQQQQTQQQQQGLQHQELTLAHLSSPKIFNDERDEVLGHLNRIQAFWGSGRAHISSNQSHVLDQSNPFHRFKAIAYGNIGLNPKDDKVEDKIGIVIKLADQSQLKTLILQYENNLKNLIPGLFGNPNMLPKLELSRINPDNHAVLSLSIIDQSTFKKVPSNVLQNFTNANVRQQLNNAFGNCLTNIITYEPPAKRQIEEYLNNPPYGIDRLLWNQAKLENPDPTRFMPVPLLGFAALNERFKFQEKETEQQKMRLKVLSGDVSSLERHVTASKAKLDECKRKHILLSNKVLRIMLTQEVIRKRGYPIQAEEDQLRAQLDTIQSELNAPTKFQGCLNELMSQLRQMQSQHQFGNVVSLDASTVGDIKAFMKQEQEGIQYLISILKQDVSDLKSLSLNDDANKQQS